MNCFFFTYTCARPGVLRQRSAKSYFHCFYTLAKGGQQQKPPTHPPQQRKTRHDTCIGSPPALHFSDGRKLLNDGCSCLTNTHWSCGCPAVSCCLKLLVPWFPSPMNKRWLCWSRILGCSFLTNASCLSIGSWTPLAEYNHLKGTVGFFLLGFQPHQIVCTLTLWSIMVPCTMYSISMAVVSWDRRYMFRITGAIVDHVFSEAPIPFKSNAVLRSF